MALNAIGNLIFFSLSGPPVFTQEQTIVRRRAGLNGPEIKFLGQWASEWQCRSIAMEATWYAALAMSHLYYEADKALTNVVYEGQALAALGHRYFVRDVRVLTIEPHITATDGSLARIEAIWSLEPIRI